MKKSSTIIDRTSYNYGNNTASTVTQDSPSNETVLPHLFYVVHPINMINIDLNHDLSFVHTNSTSFILMSINSIYP